MSLITVRKVDCNCICQPEALVLKAWAKTKSTYPVPLGITADPLIARRTKKVKEIVNKVAGLGPLTRVA